MLTPYCRHVPLLGDSGEVGRWAEEVLLRAHPVAPHLMPVEAASVLRCALLAGDLSADTAAIAHAEIQALPVDLFPCAPVASRAGALRDTLSSYDAWYVALAELLDVELATLDARLARVPEIRCGFLLPPE